MTVIHGERREARGAVEPAPESEIVTSLVSAFGAVPRGEKMLYSGTGPESYITEYVSSRRETRAVHTAVFEERSVRSSLSSHPLGFEVLVCFEARLLVIMGVHWHLYPRVNLTRKVSKFVPGNTAIEQPSRTHPAGEFKRSSYVSLHSGSPNWWGLLPAPKLPDMYYTGVPRL